MELKRVALIVLATEYHQHNDLPGRHIFTLRGDVETNQHLILHSSILKYLVQ